MDRISVFCFVFFSRVKNIARRGKLCNVFYALKSFLTIAYWIFCVLHIWRCKSDREKNIRSYRKIPDLEYVNLRY